MKLAQPISEHRIQRLMRWAMLWLAQALGWLVENEQHAPDWLKRGLDRTIRNIGFFVFALINFRAVRRVHLCKRMAPRGRIVGRSGLRRAVYGQALRKLLMRGDALTRARAVLTALLNLEALIEKQVKRLARGLTRRRGGLAREARVVFAALLAISTPRIADSS